MALTDENGSNGMVMPVQPMSYGYGGGNFGYAMPMMPMMGGYGGGFGGFGGDWGSLIVLFLIAAMFGGFGGGFGGFGMGGFGGGLGIDFPWLLNGQNGINNNVNDGFRDAQLHDSVTSVRDGVSNLATQLCGCCGDVQMSLANGFAGTTAAITGAQNALAQQLYSNQIADLERSFAAQTASTAGLNAIQSQLAQNSMSTQMGFSDAKYTLASEACATRANSTQNTQGILNAINGGIQSIKDQLCQDKIDAKNDEIAQLRQELLYSRGQVSQDVQTAAIRAGQATTANQLIQEMRSCPVPSTPVYGMTPIFTCQNNGCGCGCNSCF